MPWTQLEREIVDEDVREHAMGSCLGRCCAAGWSQTSKDNFYSCWCAKFCGVGSIMLALALGITLIILGVLLIEPHFRAQGFKPTTCNVTDIKGDEMSCVCGNKCWSRTICVKIYVNYVKNDDRTVRDRMLQQTEGYHKCTYSPCHRSRSRNFREARDIAGRYNRTRSFNCLYDPAPGTTEVVERRRYTNNIPVIMAIFWPALFVAIGLSGLIFVFLVCGCRGFWICCPPRDVTSTARALSAAGVMRLKDQPVGDRKRLIAEAASGQLQPRAPNTVTAHIGMQPTYYITTSNNY